MRPGIRIQRLVLGLLATILGAHSSGAAAVAKPAPNCAEILALAPLPLNDWARTLGSNPSSVAADAPEVLEILENTERSLRLTRRQHSQAELFRHLKRLVRQIEESVLATEQILSQRSNSSLFPLSTSSVEFLNGLRSSLSANHKVLVAFLALPKIESGVELDHRPTVRLWLNLFHRRILNRIVQSLVPDLDLAARGPGRAVPDDVISYSSGWLKLMELKESSRIQDQILGHAETLLLARRRTNSVRKEEDKVPSITFAFFRPVPQGLRARLERAGLSVLELSMPTKN